MINVSKRLKITKQTGKMVKGNQRRLTRLKQVTIRDGWVAEVEQGKGYTKIIGKNKKKA